MIYEFIETNNPIIIRSNMCAIHPEIEPFLRKYIEYSKCKGDTFTETYLRCIQHGECPIITNTMMLDRLDEIIPSWFVPIKKYIRELIPRFPTSVRDVGIAYQHKDVINDFVKTRIVDNNIKPIYINNDGEVSISYKDIQHIPINSSHTIIADRGYLLSSRCHFTKSDLIAMKEFQCSHITSMHYELTDEIAKIDDVMFRLQLI